MKLFEQLASKISAQIHAGVLRPGDRLPSIRQTCRNQHISPATVLKAYSHLEDIGEIKTRPRSGYYVSVNWKGLPPEPEISKPSKSPQICEVSELLFEEFKMINDSNVVAFGSPFANPQLFPYTKLAQAQFRSTRRLKPRDIASYLPPGNAELLRLIARRYLESGLVVRPQDVLITSGGLEALNLSLQATTRPGDLVAIESPGHWAPLVAIHRRGLKVIELPTCCREGVDLAALNTALRKHPIRACWFMTTFQSPLSSLMPDEKKQELVNMLAKYDVPLIEDGVYEELYFGAERPRPAKAYDRKGLVLHCSSFSKCLAPGYRVGWVEPGRYFKEVEWEKLTTTISTSAPMQATLVEYLKNGGYDHHLRTLRSLLDRQNNLMLQAISRYFPKEVRVTRPQGGYFIWIEMPPSVNALEVRRLAIEKKITIAPGHIFSPQAKFSNCIYLNFSMPWSPRIDVAIASLGDIVNTLIATSKLKSRARIPMVA